MKKGTPENISQPPSPEEVPAETGEETENDLTEAQRAALRQQLKDLGLLRK